MVEANSGSTSKSAAPRACILPFSFFLAFDPVVTAAADSTIATSSARDVSPNLLFSASIAIVVAAFASSRPSTSANDDSPFSREAFFKSRFWRFIRTLLIGFLLLAAAWHSYVSITGPDASTLEIFGVILVVALSPLVEKISLPGSTSIDLGTEVKDNVESLQQDSIKIQLALATAGAIATQTLADITFGLNDLTPTAKSRFVKNSLSAATESLAAFLRPSSDAVASANTNAPAMAEAIRVSAWLFSDTSVRPTISIIGDKVVSAKLDSGDVDRDVEVRRTPAYESTTMSPSYVGESLQPMSEPSSAQDSPQTASLPVEADERAAPGQTLEQTERDPVGVDSGQQAMRLTFDSPGDPTKADINPFESDDLTGPTDSEDDSAGAGAGTPAQVLTYTTGWPDAVLTVLEGTYVSISDPSPAATTFTTQQPLNYPYVAEECRPPAPTGAKYKGLLTVPLLANGRCVGILQIERQRQERFEPSATAVAKQLAALYAGALT